MDLVRDVTVISVSTYNMISAVISMSGLLASAAQCTQPDSLLLEPDTTEAIVMTFRRSASFQDTPHAL